MVLKRSKGYMQNNPFTCFRSIRRFCTVPRDTFSACANNDIDAHAKYWTCLLDNLFREAESLFIFLAVSYVLFWFAKKDK